MTCETSSVPCQVCEHRDQCPAWAADPDECEPCGEREICPSCGVPYTVHMGLTATCSELIAVRAELIEERRLSRVTVADRNAEIALRVKVQDMLTAVSGERDALRDEIERRNRWLSHFLFNAMSTVKVNKKESMFALELLGGAVSKIIDGTYVDDDVPYRRKP